MFLYSKENVLSNSICREFIEKFEASDLKGPGQIYGENGINTASKFKVSTDISFNPQMENDVVWGDLLKETVPVIIRGVEDYKNRYFEAFQSLDESTLAPVFNMQRYEPSEAFYGLHCERAGLKYSGRVLVWMIYLNTVTDRGETHFYYQNHFESPVEGKLVVWPSDWTYLHRGVASPTQTKYILTGWFNHI